MRNTVRGVGERVGRLDDELTGVQESSQRWKTIPKPTLKGVLTVFAWLLTAASFLLGEVAIWTIKGWSFAGHAALAIAPLVILAAIIACWVDSQEDNAPRRRY